mmetsp:Transcript_147/g.227  ORF Transcript_147/g.227 Transcript_147/m.227 type:complete len:104 (-) Transcript_147:338-649(-)
MASSVLFGRRRLRPGILTLFLALLALIIVAVSAVSLGRADCGEESRLGAPMKSYRTKIKIGAAQRRNKDAPMRFKIRAYKRGGKNKCIWNKKRRHWRFSKLKL